MDSEWLSASAINWLAGCRTTTQAVQCIIALMLVDHIACLRVYGGGAEIASTGKCKYEKSKYDSTQLNFIKDNCSPKAGLK